MKTGVSGHVPVTLGCNRASASWKSRFFIHVGVTSELERLKVCWSSGGGAELKIRRELKI